MNKMKLKLINVKILFSLSIVIVLFFISMALPANCASVDTDTVQNLYDVASSGHNSIGQRYDHSASTENTFSNDKVINTVLNINDSLTADLLDNFNVSRDEILRRISSAIEPAAVNNDSVTTISDYRQQQQAQSDNDGTNGETEQKEMYIDAFRRRIEAVIERNTSRNTLDPNAAVHDIAFYPICITNNQSAWLEENTAKLFFSAGIFDKLLPNIFIHRAILRLRQRSSDIEAEGQTECDPHYGCHETKDVIHVKISIFTKARGENRMKKIVCHNFTTKRDNNEWIEIDARQVIKHWLKAHRMNHSRGIVTDPMVTIDIEDESQQPLKAGIFFEPTDCQTSPAIPWNLLYGDNVRTILGNQMVPNNPRLDIKYSRMHRTHHHNGHRNHRHRNVNHLENTRHTKEPSPSVPVDYQH